jgi:hypothetical protein
MLGDIIRLVAAGTQLYGLHKAKAFDLIEGEELIRQRQVSWVREFGLKVDGVLSLTNKRLRFEFFDEYLSYPLENILSVRLVQVWKVLPNGVELGFGEGRVEVFAVWKREEWVTEILKARGRVTTASEIEKTSDGTVLDLDQAGIRRNLTFSLDESELKTLSFDLGVDYEALAGGTKVEKARELIVTCERQGLLSKLLKECSERRPHVHW